jgi:hypothetical protein
MPDSHAGNDSTTLHDDLFVTTRAIGKSVTLNEMIDRFENSPRRQYLRQATRAEYQLIYRALREHVGPGTPIHVITRERINEIADTFLHLPSRATLLSPKSITAVPDYREAVRALREAGILRAQPNNHRREHVVTERYKYPLQMLKEHAAFPYTTTRHRTRAVRS